MKINPELYNKIQNLCIETLKSSIYKFKGST